MNIEKIENLVKQAKNDFFLEKYKDNNFKKYVSEYSSFRDFTPFETFLFLLSFMGMFFIIYFLFSNILNFNINFDYAPFIMIPAFLGCFCSEKIKAKYIMNKCSKNDKFKNSMLNTLLLPDFLKNPISDKILQQLKLELNIDQFKALKVLSGTNITYENLTYFINNIQTIDFNIHEAEEDKYTLNHIDVKQYIKTT